MLIVNSPTQMRGTLLAAGLIKLDGWFDGEVICSRLEIGADGYLLGNVAAREVVIAGQIVGTINAGRVAMLDGSFVEGDIYHVSLVKAPRATLIGTAYSTRGALKLPADLLSLEAKVHRDAAAAPAPSKAPVVTTVTEAQDKVRRMTHQDFRRLI